MSATRENRLRIARMKASQKRARTKLSPEEQALGFEIRRVEVRRTFAQRGHPGTPEFSYRLYWNGAPQGSWMRASAAVEVAQDIIADLKLKSPQVRRDR